MSYQAVREYLLAIVGRYQGASKQEKSRLLAHAVEATSLSRKQLIRRLKQSPAQLRKLKASGAPRRYPEHLLLPHVAKLWVSMERISAKRMKAALPEWLGFYLCPVEIKFLLTSMSASTLDRFLRTLRRNQEFKKGLTSTSPARWMKNRVPLNTFDQKIDRPGFTQSDTVAHCGNTLQGAFANSITLTDIASAWTENRALFSKKGHAVRAMFIDIERTLPFDLLAVNVDSGSEFLNNPVVNWAKGVHGGRSIQFTRSRAYRKNDNCYVEQKNFTHVRELFGYERISEPSFVELMNEIYRDYWGPLQNFFLPTFKLKEKIRVGAKVKKKFGAPETPFSRLMKSPHLSETQKAALLERKKTLNPFQLKVALEAKLKTFFDAQKRSKIGGESK